MNPLLIVDLILQEDVDLPDDWNYFSYKENRFWTLMSETDLLPNIQGPLLSQSTKEVNCAGMHFYHIYNHPVQALRQIHHSVVLERNWLASRHYREPNICCCFIDWQSLCPVSVWLEYNLWNQRMCGSNGCEGKDKIQKKIKDRGKNTLNDGYTKEQL